MAADMKLVRHALEIARERRYATVEIEAEGLVFSAQLSKPRRLTPQPTAEVPLEPVASTSKLIKSSWVGYFGHSEPAVRPGSVLEADTIVGVVTVLGIGNDVAAGVAGDVEEVLVREGDPVEYGQVLFKVKP